MERKSWWPLDDKEKVSDPLVRGAQIEMEEKADRLKQMEAEYNKNKNLMKEKVYEDSPVKKEETTIDKAMKDG